MHLHFQCPRIFIAIRCRTALPFVTFAVPRYHNLSTFIVQIDSAAVTSSIFQISSSSSTMHRRERTRSNSIMLEDIKSALFVRLVNVAIYVLHLVAHTTLHPPDT